MGGAKGEKTVTRVKILPIKVPGKCSRVADNHPKFINNSLKMALS
jgi:hypothetical protein